MRRASPTSPKNARVRLEPHVDELLGATDAFVATRARWRSLAPGRGAPHTLREIGLALLADRAPLHDQQAIAWAMALSDLARAICREFPENVFTDLDHVAAELLRVVHESGHVELERVIDPLVRIHRAYGVHSRIRFRYVHDFLYGFDWSRWVAREPAARGATRPFGRELLAHVERRATELDALVEAGDETYPPLPPGAFRNPFPFDREPASEIALLSALAEEDLLPVRAFDARAPIAPQRPYTALREARARALGLVRPT